jgi:TonB family protein
MARHAPTLRLLATTVVLSSITAIVTFRAQAADELAQHLRDKYGDKTLVLRNFYSGKHLKYDSAGTLAGVSAVSGDWTVDGFVRVKSVTLRGQRLTVRAVRIPVGSSGQSFHLLKHLDELRIEVEFDAGGMPPEDVDRALSKIFLTAHDRLVETVPDYWKPCVLAASTGKGGKQYDDCRFPQAFAAIPGIVYSFDETSELDQTAARAWESAVITHLGAGKGVTPPKAIASPAPEFSEQARSAKYQGFAVLSIFVDKTGETRELRIVRPLGMGLDQKAVEAVAKWRFKPATKDGDPIDMNIAVEVDFHLY